MKIHFVGTPGPVGQFVVEAENENDKGILSLFCNELEKQGRYLRFHSSCYKEGRTVAFNFGVDVKEEPCTSIFG